MFLAEAPDFWSDLVFFYTSCKWHFSFLISIVYQGGGSQRAAAVAASLGMLNSWLSGVTCLHICTNLPCWENLNFSFKEKKKNRCQKASWCRAADRRLLLDSVHHPAPRRKFWANGEGAAVSLQRQEINLTTTLLISSLFKLFIERNDSKYLLLVLHCFFFVSSTLKSVSPRLKWLWLDFRNNSGTLKAGLAANVHIIKRKSTKEKKQSSCVLWNNVLNSFLRTVFFFYFIFNKTNMRKAFGAVLRSSFNPRCGCHCFQASSSFLFL